jgi:DtxR family Mn-dependent transcriptional regulator
VREETYLRIAYMALEEGRDIIGPSFVAKELGISRPAAQEALLKLAEKDYGDYIAGKGFKLNVRGVEKGKEVTCKHRLIECLFEEIGLEAEEACREATRIEGFVSRKAFEKLRESFYHRDHCPCGKEIRL